MLGSVLSINLGLLQYHCYSCHLEYSPKAYVLKAWSPSCHSWEVVVPLRGESWWEVFRSLGVWPGRELWDGSLFLLLLPGHEWSSCAVPHTPTILCCLATGPKHWGQLILDRNHQNCEPKQPLSLLSRLSQVFCKVRKGWLTAFRGQGLLFLVM
jgi:hypothetical protein